MQLRSDTLNVADGELARLILLHMFLNVKLLARHADANKHAHLTNNPTYQIKLRNGASFDTRLRACRPLRGSTDGCYSA